MQIIFHKRGLEFDDARYIWSFTAKDLFRSKIRNDILVIQIILNVHLHVHKVLLKSVILQVKYLAISAFKKKCKSACN